MASHPLLFLADLFKTASSVSTALGLLGLAVAAWLVWQLYKSRQETARLNSIPEGDRARHADAYLSRYGVRAEGASPSRHIALIQEEMRRRFYFKVISLIVAAIVTVVCFSVAVFGGNGNVPLRPAPEQLFNVIDKDVEEPLRRAFSVSYSSDGKESSMRTKVSELGQFRIPGSAVLIRQVTLDDPMGYKAYAPDHQDRQLDNHGIVRLYFEREHEHFRDSIMPDTSKVSVPLNEYSSLTTSPHNVDPQEVKLWCDNDTDHTVDLFLYRYLPQIDRSNRILEDLDGPRTCSKNRDEDTILWKHFDPERGGVFFFYWSIGGSKAKAIRTFDGSHLREYLFRSANPRLKIWMNGEEVLGRLDFSN